MRDINELYGAAITAADMIMDQGGVGAVLVLSLLVNLLLGWLLWKTRDKYTDHLETHYDRIR